MNEATRAYVYRIATAVLVLAATTGVIVGDATITAVGGLISAVLAAPLAVANTSTR